jgi:hypothetical protein
MRTQVGSEPFGKFSTLLYASTGYKIIRFDPFSLEMIRSDRIGYGPEATVTARRLVKGHLAHYNNVGLNTPESKAPNRRVAVALVTKNRQKFYIGVTSV